MTNKSSFELAEHIGGGKKSVFLVDGSHVSESYYRALDEAAVRRDTFHTSAVQVPGGRFRRTNRKVIYL